MYTISLYGTRLTLVTRDQPYAPVEKQPSLLRSDLTYYEPMWAQLPNGLFKP